MASSRSDRGQVGAHEARFVASVAAPSEFPAGPPEIAFVGRSNVGKSSLLNALVGRRGLARTSKTPGRTQRANLFDVRFGKQPVRLVDLPGYGHANAPQHVRQAFGPMIEGWLIGSAQLVMAAILVDARRDPNEDTLNFLLWLRQQEVPAEVVFTKVDKIARNKRKGHLLKLARAYELERKFHATSSHDGSGIDALRAHIGRLAKAAGPALEG